MRDPTPCLALRALLAEGDWRDLRAVMVMFGVELSTHATPAVSDAAARHGDGAFERGLSRSLRAPVEPRTILGDDGPRKYPSSQLLLSSAQRGWAAMSAELRAHPVGQIVSAEQADVEIVIALTGMDDGLVIRNGAGMQQQSRPTTGTIWLAPTGVGPEEIILTAPIPQALHLYLPLQQFDTLADQYGLARSWARSVQYIGGLRDDLIRRIGESLVGELRQETATSRMVAETSAMALAARLIHGYAGRRLFDPGPAGSCPLDQARLRRVMDFIDEHLEEEFTLAAMAELVHLSPFHFSRMFAAAIGMPPFRYVSRRRLEAAMAMLTAGRLPLAEIAFRSGFSSQAAFTRAFRRATRMTPGDYRRSAR
jgi:AraC family transcriptional regulator